jgi:hypothetical protein
MVETYVRSNLCLFFYIYRVSLVNKSVIDYFMVELHIEEHFQALRRYLFMGDGDFSQILSDLLFNKVHVKCNIFLLSVIRTFDL